MSNKLYKIIVKNSRLHLKSARVSLVDMVMDCGVCCLKLTSHDILQFKETLHQYPFLTWFSSG